MNNHLRLILLAALVALAVACNTLPAPVSEEPVGSLAASDATRMKTSIQTWNIVSAGALVTVRGLDAGGKALQTLEGGTVTANGRSVTKRYFNASGAQIRTDVFVVNSTKQPATRPTEAVDSSLCPECMANDLENLSVSGRSAGKLQPQLSLACGQARSRLAKAMSKFEKRCVFGADPLVCGDAAADYYDAVDAAISACA